MPTPTPDPDPTAGKTLIVYYSFTNNVHTIVSDLQTQIEADVVRVEPAEEGLDYAANNYAIGSALIQAIRNNPNDAASYPEIKPVEVNIADYDRIIVGAPLWWSNMAAPLQTLYPVPAAVSTVSSPMPDGSFRVATSSNRACGYVQAKRPTATR